MSTTETLQSLAETYMAECYGAGDERARLEEFVEWSEGQVEETEAAYHALRKASRTAKPECETCNTTGEVDCNGRILACPDCEGLRIETMDVQWDAPRARAVTLEERRPADVEHRNWIAVRDSGGFIVAGSSDDKAELVRRYARPERRIFGVFSTREAAHAALDDARLICSSCRPGTGRYRCDACQSAILVAGLAGSIAMNADRVA